MGIRSHRWTLAITAADLFGIGYPDLFLSNDYGVPELFANQAANASTTSLRKRALMTPKSGMNASVGDIFNDGRLAIYKTNITEPSQLLQGNDLWVPKSDGSKTFETWRQRWESSLAGGAGARSSAT